MKKRFLLTSVFVLFFILSSFVIADPPQFIQNEETTGFLQIVYPQQEVYLLDDDITLNWVVFNSSGFRLNASKEVDCNFGLRNSSNKLLKSGKAGEDNTRFNQSIETGTVDIYGYVIYCNASNGEHGYLSGYYYVTKYGKNYPPGTDSLTGLLLIAAIFAVGFLLLYLSFNLDRKKHFFLQLIIIVFVVMISTLISKTAIDYADNYGTSETFFKAIYWFIRVFWIYIFFYLFFEIGKPIINWFKDLKGK